MALYQNNDYLGLYAISGADGFNRKVGVQQNNADTAAQRVDVTLKIHVNEGETPISRPWITNPYMVQMQISKEKVKRVFPGAEQELVFTTPFTDLAAANSALENIIELIDSEGWFD